MDGHEPCPANILSIPEPESQATSTANILFVNQDGEIISNHRATSVGHPLIINEEIEALSIENIHKGVNESYVEIDLMHTVAYGNSSEILDSESTGSQKLALSQFGPMSDINTSNVIELSPNCKESNGLPSLSHEEQLEQVPDMVASETVVTTCNPPPRRRKQRLHEVGVLLEGGGVEVAGSQLDLGAENPGWTLHVDGLYLEQQPSPSTSLALDTQHVVEILTSDDNSNYNATPSVDIPLTSLEIPTVSLSGLDLGYVHRSVDKSTFQAEVRTMTKRQRDRLKKRELRMDPEFRMREKAKSKERMRLRRQDMQYREAEREKDRIRRWHARRNDGLSRQRERERDNEYKRNHRKTVKQNAETLINATQLDMGSYSIGLGDIEGVEL